MIDPIEVLETKLRTVTLREVADQAGMDPTNVVHVRKGRRSAPDALLNVLGLERVTIIRRKRKGS